MVLEPNSAGTSPIVRHESKTENHSHILWIIPSDTDHEKKNSPKHSFATIKTSLLGEKKKKKACGGNKSLALLPAPGGN